ncbi:OLC1v1029477C1 [Oldenlandia corymbosa var. corymbosa]|uniref:OLC1v1029477C1 n=1 Tax=Oldenlandia corymbosa var. corymbosa TaxID=529605 RepID=A0AAV1CG08_OLDCO|nr:OLC1v1029477C1 [Oldenlandia corymbosa var. corymbosa]
MASPAIKSSFRYVLFTYFVVILMPSLLMLNKGTHASEEILKAEKDFHLVEVSSILPPLTCKSTASRGPKEKSTLKIVHRSGPCYNGESIRLTLSQILSHDQARVASIQSSRPVSIAETNGIRDRKTSIPNKPGSAYIGTDNFSNYVVTVGLGTPKKSYTLVFDTGSDLTWTQCQPCKKKICYRQNDPIYDPLQSLSYSNVSCSSPQCSLLIAGTGYKPGCTGSTCVYSIQYGDESYSVGLFAKETLTLGSDSIPGFLFGCGQSNRGSFGKNDGLLGLGRSKISLVSQTAKKYGEVFSYCLPTPYGSNGFLSFGKGVYSSSKTVKFTPFSASELSEYYYAVDLVSISVGGKLLPISFKVFQKAGTIVDSGTFFTWLPPAAYSALSRAFRKQMTSYKQVPGVDVMDACYDFTGLTSIKLPKISFIFRGNVTVDLGANGILTPVSGQKQVCLAFAANSDASELGIFGNVQQQTMQMVFDVAGRRLGFGPLGGCS